MYYWDGLGPTSNQTGMGRLLNLPPYWRQHWTYDFEPELPFQAAPENPFSLFPDEHAPSNSQPVPGGDGDVGPEWRLLEEPHPSAPPTAGQSFGAARTPVLREAPQAAAPNHKKSLLQRPASPQPEPWLPTDVGGEVVRASEMPEQPSRRMTTAQDAAFMKMLRDGASAQQLRDFVKRSGIPRFNDNFEEIVRLRDRKKPVADHVAYQLPPVPKQADGALGAAARGFADPWNLLDEAGAVVDLLGGTDGRQNVWNSDRSLKDLYYDNVDLNRAILQADERDHPWARLGGQVASNFVLPIGNKASTAGQLAKWGAMEGGLAGFGAGEGVDRLPQAALGAVAGGATGYTGGRALEATKPFFEVTRSALGFPRMGPHGPIYSHLSRDYEAARDRLLTEKTGEVPGVLYHREIGPIDLIYGNEKYGLKHIEVGHPDVMDSLPSIVEQAPVRRYPSEDHKGRFWLQDPEYDALVPTEFDNQPKNWLLTAYRRDGAPGDQTTGRDPLSPDGVSTGAEQSSSIDVPQPISKTERAAERASRLGGSKETAISVRSNKQFRSLPKGTWVEFHGKCFPKS